jgi:hypothetical protein
MPDARPSSDCSTLDITDAVSGATSTANEIPNSAIGQITPIARPASPGHPDIRDARSNRYRVPGTDRVREAAKWLRQKTDTNCEGQECQPGFDRWQTASSEYEEASDVQVQA